MDKLKEIREASKGIRQTSKTSMYEGTETRLSTSLVSVSLEITEKLCNWKKHKDTQNGQKLKL
jgi:hypothetical protein